MLTSFDAVLAELAELREAAVTRGPWTLAQALAHCAQSIDCSLTGYPRLRAWPLRALVGPLVKRRFLSRGVMSHDTAAPIAGAPAFAADLTLAQSVAQLRASIASFRAWQNPLAPHLLYGRCGKDEYEQLHAMHIADHLGAFR